MIVGHGTYELHGTEAQKAIVLPCFVPGDPSFIAFPWDRLDPPSTPIPIGWMNLNAALGVEATRALRASGVERVHGFADESHDHSPPPSALPGHVHVEDEYGREGHGILRLIDGRWWVAGVFWTDGRIYVDTRCESEPALAREVVSAELAHSVDYFLPLSDGMKNALMSLWHRGVADDGHTWWETHDYGAEYYDLGGEAFMAAFTLAYSSLVPDQSAFTHKARAEESALVRAILGVPATWEAEPVEETVRIGRGRKRHRVVCWVVAVARTLGRRIEPAPPSLPPCRICRPQ